ncbi:toxin-antitoxin system YwqK family antitoxin [Flavobacterium sp.]|uniref:toxin-antitoxin system YwqK family antitoxin n=1 Tax=Flavobacterium sp. TaxID=239 RepID=UPI00374CE9E2
MRSTINKKYLIYIFLLSISFGYAQIKKIETPKPEPVKPQVSPNSFDENGLRQGLWNGFYDDSKILRYVGNFNHGKEVGVFTYYANSDKKIVMATRNFDSKNNAYTIFFDDKNNKVSEGNTINKFRSGLWKYYHKNSKLVMTTENYVNDKIEGIRKVFYTNGKLAEEVPYKNNLKEGISKKYSKKGKLIEESVFANDVLQGPYKVYDESGNLVIKGQFKNDKKNAIWQYFENGKLVREMNADTINGHKKPSLKEKK